MDPIERQRRIFELLDGALELPAPERGAFLDQRCDAPELLREVEAMLSAEPDTGVLEAPAFSVHARDPALGRTIGGYRLVELLDRGGMGSVYLAEREDFEQRVALKLIRRGLDLDDVLVRRFHNERQILARLDHPNIARLLDGGTTEDRLPYFVMELVDGEPIDRYCERRGLSLAERLRLFRKVCSAVQFAHRNLVVHRDLKPGNVLITADGEPKLLDFGIAKLLDDGLAAHALATVPGQGPMTPRYASPEQIRLEPITTASDVYSLGVLLYELLTGVPPYRVDGDRSDEVARAVCEQEPERPSTAVRRRGEASRPGLPDPGRLRQRLAGDLDSIVLKALRKEPEGRYGSAEQLSEDLRRHLSGLPVTARDGTSLYLLGKFVRRHRLALAVVAAFVLLSTGFGVVSTVLRQQAVESRGRAERERSRAEEMLEFLQNLFKKADPDEAGGEELTALDLLRRGKEELLAERWEDPELRIDLTGTLGQLFLELGSYGEARELMAESLAIAREHHGGDHSEVAKRISNLAAVLHALGDHAEAEKLLREALKMRRRLGQEGADLFRTRNNLASTLISLKRFQEAEELYLETLRGRTALYGPDDPDVATSLSNLGALYLAMDDLERAEDHLRRALEIRLQGDEETLVASTLDLLGEVTAARGDGAEAEQLHRRALEIRRRLLGEDHPLVARSRKNLGTVLIHRDPEAARELLTRAVEDLARSHAAERELAEAESALGELDAHLEQEAERGSEEGPQGAENDAANR